MHGSLREISGKCRSSWKSVSCCLPYVLSTKGVLRMTLLPVSLRCSSAWHSLPISHMHEADQIQRLASLETRVLTLQEQLAQLTLALLQERERSVEQRLTALESLLQPFIGRPMPDPSAKDGSTRSCLCGAAASRAPSRRTPGSVAQTSTDRIQRAGKLRDHQFTRRRGTTAARFASVV
jgi:hypothetical protein